MAFKYRPVSPETLERVATAQGDEFTSFIKSDYRVFKVKNDNAIRILPRSWGEEYEEEWGSHWGIYIWVHYQVGPEKASVLCNYHMKKGACPLCESRAKAQRDDDEQLARDLAPKRRCLVWLVDRKEEEQGVQLWAIPAPNSTKGNLDREIGKACKDRATGKWHLIDDPENGRDVFIDREGQPPQIEYTPQISSKITSVDDRYLEYIDKHPLPEVLIWRDYDELKALFEGTSAKPKSSGSGNGRDSEREADNAVIKRGLQERQSDRSQDERVTGRQNEAAAEAADDGKLPFDGEIIPPEKSAPATPREPLAAMPAGQSGSDRAAAIRARIANRQR